MTITEKDLPLLNFVNNLYPKANADKVLIVACQHILETTNGLFDAIINRGVSPKNIYLIGKCYSTNESVFNELKASGIRISPLSMAYKSHQSFDDQFKSYINQFCLQIQKEVDLSDFNKIIVLDDGGELMFCMSKMLGSSGCVVGIEQTSSGFERIKNKRLDCPIINVAKSFAKLKVESPFIAEVVINKVEEYIRQNKMKDPKILVVGQGAIGKSIAGLLEKKFHTVKYDVATHNHPFPGDYEKDLNKFDMIIGATGSQVIGADEFCKLNPGVVLISASSSDREFSAVTLRRMEEENGDCHKEIIADNIKLPNSGFPINFDGSRDSVSKEKIQFTRALLLAGVLTGLSRDNLENGIIEIDESVQEAIINEFHKILSNL